MFEFVPTLLILVVLLVIASIKVIREYERAVVFRLGRLILPPLFNVVSKSQELLFLTALSLCFEASAVFPAS